MSSIIDGLAIGIVVSIFAMIFLVGTMIVQNVNAAFITSNAITPSMSTYHVYTADINSVYAFVIWILLGVYASLRTSLINKLVVAALVLIVAGSLLEFFPISNGFGCAQYTGNVCTTTNQASQADNIAIFDYYTLISAVLAIFIDTMRSGDSATPHQA